MSLVRSSSTIGLLTLVSRILGFVRDVLMARIIGAGFASDAFLVAFRLPNLFRALFAEGAFSAAFVPMFNRKLAQEGKEEANRFVEHVLAMLTLILLVFTAVIMAAAGPVVWAMTGGFSGGAPGKLDFTVELSRITFPYLALIALASLFGGILNSLGRFWVAAAAPILLNLCLIAALILSRGQTDVGTARAQAVAVTVSGVLQLAWLVFAARRVGMRPRLRLPKLGRDVRALMRLILPAALGAGAVQVNLLVSTFLAGRFLPEGSISHLYYADRLGQLPLGLIGIGVGTALLPLLSRQLANGSEDAAMHSQNRAIQLTLLLTLPACAALVVSAGPLVAGLLQSGEFGAADSTATAAALAAFALGLPAYVLIKVLTPGFYARSDTSTPVRIAILSMLVNLALNFALIWDLAQVGLALSTAIAAWVNVAALYLVLRRRGHFRMDARLKRVLPRALLATAAMTALLLFLNGQAAALIAEGLAGRVAGLALLVAAGGAMYFAAAFALRALTLEELRTQLPRRSRPQPGPPR
ncbi:MAG TPA: murein biosynthesis integral membrane protein MurJ [Allosphingosinicella sp.]